MKGKNKHQIEKAHDTIICLPDITPIDITKSCPRYTSSKIKKTTFK
jgi:hypothetical protein